jgi:hypothetical protein
MSNLTQEEIAKLEIVKDKMNKLFAEKFPLEEKKKVIKNGDVDEAEDWLVRVVLFWIDQCPLKFYKGDLPQEQQMIVAKSMAEVEFIQSNLSEQAFIALKHAIAKKIGTDMNESVNGFADLQKSHPELITQGMQDSFAQSHAETLYRLKFFLDKRD